MKRLLSLLLMCSILFCMASGIHAINYEDRFADWNEIENQASVALLSDLSLIGGFQDGNFRPDYMITRAEISKMVAMLKTADAPKAAKQAAFGDVAGHWAEAYISYCVQEQIISGDGSGKFRPDENVTTRELAKMLLVTLGNAPSQYVGSSWKQTVDEDAKAAGIYDGFDKNIDRDAYITRGDAALLFTNAMQSEVILGTGADGKAQYALDSMMSPKSLLEYRYEIQLVTGVVEANAVADLRSGAGELTKNTVHISGYTRDFKLLDDRAAYNESLLGREVTVYAIFGAQYHTAYGLPAVRPNQYAATMAQWELRSLMGAEALQMTDKTKIYRNYVAAGPSCIEEMGEGDSVTVIDHGSDQVIDYMLFSIAPVVEEVSR